MHRRPAASFGVSLPTIMQSLALLLASVAVLPASAPRTDGPVYHGRRNETAVTPPRLEGAAAQVSVDGRLVETAWARAAVLTGFSQYAPVDGRPAADSTEVRVFYSPTAIYFGIRAFEVHGAVRATLADRDRITADDFVEIIIGTFNDRRQVSVFAVNALGVQMDGTMLAGNRTPGGFSGTQDSRERPDLSADYVFQSKGRVTETGYEIELRIPFKSLRYQSADVQSWSLNVVRRVQHSGYEDSWVPALQSHASFVAQAGTLDGLRGIERGLVLDLVPEVTSRVEGRADAAGRYRYDDIEDVGFNARWGVTNNLTMNATANPDFSQVESDAGQFQFDPRQRVIYAERRPFFLEGIEQFQAPFSLIHTRNIVQPRGAAKLTGKAAGTNVALLGAVDDRFASVFAGDTARRAPLPMFGVARLTRDLGGQSRVGATLTHRADGPTYNSVGAADVRFVLGKIYSLSGMLGGSVTDSDDGRGSVRAPIWQGQLTRSGRRFGFRYGLSGISEDFDAHVGAISRGGVANLSINHRLSTFGGHGALVESYTVDVNTTGTWKYQRFVDGKDAIEKKLHLNHNLRLRGGWSAGASVLVETFGYDDDLFRSFRTLQPAAGGGVDTVPYSGTPRLANLDWVFNVATPAWRRFSGNAFYVMGVDENFYEWSRGDIRWLSVNANVRPTERMRVAGTYQMQEVKRHTDGSLVARWSAPRLKLEYQLARPLFVRAVGEYTLEQRDSLRDDSRTNLPIYRQRGDGSLVRALGFRDQRFRADYLVSYTPTPGTVLYAGYGSTRSARTLDMRRRPDEMPVLGNGVFVKASYLFRVN